MSFIVRYQSDSATEHELFDTLDDALTRVESLHNDPSTAGATLFKQVPLKVQTVVRVMLEDADEPITLEEPAANGPTEPPPGAMPLQPATVAPPPPADTGSEDSGKRRFSR
jgi:hypothetical protein